MFRKMIAILLILCCLVGSAALAEGNYGWAVIDAKTSDRVHLREKEDVNSASKGLYFTGTVVTCLSDTTKTWVKVSIGSEVGYMKGEFLRVGGSVESRQPVGYVQSEGGAVLRARPSADAQARADLPRGSAVTIQGETHDRWYLVTAAGQEGYVFHEEISASLNLPKAMAYLEAMQNRQQVTEAETGKQLYLNQLGVDGRPYQYDSFAVLDLDGDQKAEVVLTIRDGYGSIVLDNQNGTIYAYLLWYRAMNGIKADGTYSYSSGAFDSGYARISFKDGVFTDKPFTYLENGVPYVNGKKASQSAFDAAVQQQEKKAEPAWFLYNAENVAALLSK